MSKVKVECFCNVGRIILKMPVYIEHLRVISTIKTDVCPRTVLAAELLLLCTLAGCLRSYCVRSCCVRSPVVYARRLCTLLLCTLAGANSVLHLGPHYCTIYL